MNQAIQFPDRVTWQPQEERIQFPALQQGALISCYISRRRLERMTGLVLTSEQDIVRAFESVRFDIEDIAEEIIEEQGFATDGAIYL